MTTRAAALLSAALTTAARGGAILLIVAIAVDPFTPAALACAAVLVVLTGTRTGRGLIRGRHH